MSQLLLPPHIEPTKIFWGIDYAEDYIEYVSTTSLVTKIYVDGQMIPLGLSREEIRAQKELDIYNNELCQYILN